MKMSPSRFQNPIQNLPKSKTKFTLIHRKFYDLPASMRFRRGYINVALKGKVQNTKSFATLRSAILLKEQTRGKRLSANERRARLEEFVDKYRSSNQGRFPTVSHAKNHIGGCYYTVRQIIQEMEYKHRVFDDTRHGDFQTSKMEKEKLSSSLSELSSSTPEEAYFPHKDAKVTVNFVVDEQGEAKKSPLSDDFEDMSVTVERNEDDQAHFSQQILSEARFEVVHELSTSEESNSCNDDDLSSDFVVPRESERRVFGSYYEEVSDHMEDNKSLRSLEDEHISNDVHQISSHDIPNLEVLSSDNSATSQDGQSLPKGSGLWNSLKSLAGGIVNIWKKR